MIKVNVWKGWESIATTYTLKEFEEMINKHDIDINNLSIEFVVE